MHFDLIDRVVSFESDRIVTIKQVSAAEEYLQDHFPTFPVLPGVMMLEAMTQACRRLVEHLQLADPSHPLVLGRVRALKYGRFVEPGMALQTTATLSTHESGVFEFKAQGEAIRADAEGVVSLGTACSGRLTLRPVRLRPRAWVGEPA